MKLRNRWVRLDPNSYLWFAGEGRGSLLLEDMLRKCSLVLACFPWHVWHVCMLLAMFVKEK